MALEGTAEVESCVSCMPAAPARQSESGDGFAACRVVNLTFNRPLWRGQSAQVSACNAVRCLMWSESSTPPQCKAGVKVDARSERWREHRKKVRNEIVDAAFLRYRPAGPLMKRRTKNETKTRCAQLS